MTEIPTIYVSNEIFDVIGYDPGRDMVNKYNHEK